jgi:hypothetical protein
MFREPGRDFDLGKILERDFDFAALEFAVYHLVNVRFGVVDADGFALRSVSTPVCSAVMIVTPTFTFGSRRKSLIVERCK